MGNSANTIDENLAKVTDKVVGEGLNGGNNFVAEIVDAEALAEVVDAVPATESVFESFGELTNEADGFVDDNRCDEDEDKGKGKDNDDVG